MAEYHVEWAIEVEADSPEEAALHAQSIQRHPDTWATCFTVLGPDRQTTEIDLSKQHFTVAIYLEDRAYGGPEEGGWHYDCGEWQDQGVGGFPPSTLFSDENEAIAYAEQVNLTLDAKANAERRSDIGSVLSEGRYRAIVHDGDKPPTSNSPKPVPTTSERQPNG